MEGSASRVVAASPDLVYAAISDVRRIPEWSAECYRCEWLDSGSDAICGRRFRGRSRSGLMRWAKTCEVTSADPPRTFGFRTLASWRSPSSTEWRYDLEPAAGGTRLTESYVIHRAPPGPLLAVIALLAPHHFDMTPDLAATLERIDGVLTGSEGTSRP